MEEALGRSGPTGPLVTELALVLVVLSLLTAGTGPHEAVSDMHRASQRCIGDCLLRPI